MLPRRCLLSLCGLLVVMTVFVGHVPIGEDDDARWKPFPLSSFFRVADFEIDIVRVLQLLAEGALKFVGPFGVVLDDHFKVIEELAVGVDPRNFNVGPSVLNDIALEEWNGLQFLQARDEPIEGLVEFNNLLKEREPHSPPPVHAERPQRHSVLISGLWY
jgi:hypothetical protein